MLGKVPSWLQTLFKRMLRMSCSFVAQIVTKKKSFHSTFTPHEALMGLWTFCHDPALGQLDGLNRSFRDQGAGT